MVTGIMFLTFTLISPKILAFSIANTFSLTSLASSGWLIANYCYSVIACNFCVFFKTVPCRVSYSLILSIFAIKLGMVMAYPITKFRFLLIITSSSLISMIYSSVFESSFDLDFIYSIINF